MSDLYNIIILPEAQEDIQKIVLYIARQYFDPLKALELQDEIKEKNDSLAILRVCYPGIKDYELKEQYDNCFLSELYPGVALSRNTVSDFSK